MTSSYPIPDVLPILVLPANNILYPSLVLSLQLARPDSLALLQALLRDAEDAPGNKALIVACVPLRGPDPDGNGGVLVSKPDPAQSNRKPAQEDIYEYGTAARIIRLERSDKSGYLAVVEGIARVSLDTFTSNASYHEAHITVHPSVPLPSSSSALLPSLQSAATALLASLATVSPLPPLLTRRLRAFVAGVSHTTSPALVDILFAHIPSLTLPFADKLSVLAAVDSVERVQLAIEILGRVAEGLDLKKRIGEKVDANLSRRQREFLLLQQLAAIRQELEELAAKDGGSGGAGVLGGPGGGKVSKKSPGGEEEAEEEDDMADIERRVKAKNWTDESRKVAMRELKRLKKSPPQGAEHGVIRNYLDWLLAIPWNDATPLPLSRDFVAAARVKLDEDHYGLEKIKKRLLEWLAVLRLQQESRASSSSTSLVLHTPTIPPLSPSTETSSTALVHLPPSPTPAPRDKGPILLLCGPPGTGKTSIAKSLADAMGRKFYRISLGGVRDEAEIRGHRRTYVAALPGALAMALRKTGVNNPVILLDEIDKLGMSSTHGDPGAALLEVLDPEQNWCFQDHYLGIPLDLSSVLFIATANTLDTISDPLYDRMEVIELSGYVHDEKLHIARKYLLPKQLRANALPPHLLSIPDPVLLHLITAYTREAGVRTVERELGAVCRAKAVEYAEARDQAFDANKDGERKEEVDVEKWGYKKEVTLEDLERMLGTERYDAEEMDVEELVGVSTGLAYQGSGNGGILHIESTSMPGSGGFHLTGQLGEVISESAQLAFAWVKSHAYELGIASSRTEDVFSAINIHVHLPAGSIRKDGPSAGVALVVAVVSLMRGIKVKPRLAMTGEITLRGNVTAVGGIKEKVLAAHRAGIRTVILPAKNEKDVAADLPASVKADVTFVYVRTIWEALEAAFGADELWEGGEPGRRGVVVNESRL